MVDLSLVVGAVVADAQTEVITRDRLQRYAQASGDHNPLHLNPDFARKAGFDDVIAHGMLGMALLGRVLTEKFGAQRLRNFSARFVAPISVGEALRCVARIASVDDECVDLELEALDSSGRPVINGHARLQLSD